MRRLHEAPAIHKDPIDTTTKRVRAALRVLRHARYILTMVLRRGPKPPVARSSEVVSLDDLLRDYLEEKVGNDNDFTDEDLLAVPKRPDDDLLLIPANDFTDDDLLLIPANDFTDEDAIPTPKLPPRR